jgi:hypothetical protein
LANIAISRLEIGFYFIYFGVMPLHDSHKLILGDTSYENMRYRGVFKIGDVVGLNMELGN